MPQTIVLEPGTTADTSDDIVVAAGESVTVGIYTADADTLLAGVDFIVRQQTPGGDNSVTRLGNQWRATVLGGPGTYRVYRPGYEGAAFGVFKES